MVKPFYLLLLLFCHADLIYSQIRVADVFSDNMVLQREEDIPVWGIAGPGSAITVEFHNNIVNTIAGKDGSWEVFLPAMEAGGPYHMVVKGEQEIIVFHNVLVGDVWYASGQSNMEHPMQGWSWLPNSAIYRYEDEIADSDYPEIRLFNVPKYPADERVTDIPHSKWKIPSPETLPDFSSTAWFFAKMLYLELKVPIGIINCSWTGSSIKTWMSRDALLASGDTAARIQQEFPGREELEGILKRNKTRRMFISYPEQQQRDSILKLDKRDWQKVYEVNTYKSESEISWIEKTIQIPEPYAKESLVLSLGFLDRQSIVYFNGHETGHYLYPEPVFTIIPRSIILPGENTITVRLAQPFGITSVKGSGDLFYLADRDSDFHYDLSKDWKINPIPEIIPVSEDDYHNRPSALFNGMVNPVIPFGIKGIIWYQGEDDAGQASSYRRKLESLITDYRTKWKKEELPFLLIQASSYQFSHENDSPDLWKALREAQNISLPYTGMVISTDIGDPYDVHPRNKKAFGERLAVKALRIIYSRIVESQ